MGENPPIESSLQPNSGTAPQAKYAGTSYDVYALVAGTLGGSSLLMCLSFNLALYCLPVIPLVLGIVALRKANMSVDPKRTRNLAWLGIAGGGLGTLFIIAMIALFILYFAFLFAIFATAIQSSPRR